MLYTPDISPLHRALAAVGLPVPSLITNPNTALWAIAFADTWEWFPFTMLIILAAFSLFAGVLNPGFGILHERPMEHWLEPVFRAASEHAVLYAHNNDAHWAEHMEWPLAIGGIGAFAIGTALAWWMYIAKKGEPAQELAKNAQGLYRLLLAKWRVDELYEATIIAAVISLLLWAGMVMAGRFIAFDESFDS